MKDARAARLTGNQCYCRDCDEYLTSVTNFDKHLKGSGRPTCRDPSEVGLVKDSYGYWKQPGPEGYVFGSVKREETTE